jgi:hypothetical protein
MAPGTGNIWESPHKMISVSRAYEATEDARERVNDLDYGAEAIDQLEICIPKVSERRFSLLK